MQELEKILEEIAVDEGYLTDWYINSTDDSEPVWTDEHIEELAEDFILIPKSEIRKHMNNGWILVEERLPEAGEHVIVSFKCTGFQPVIAHLSEEGRWMMLQGAKGFNDVTNKVSAWRPLPEPYRKKDR